MLFGGIKRSRFFSFGIVTAIAEFTEDHLITIDISADQFPFYVKRIFLFHFSLSENMLSFYFLIDSSSSISAPEND